MNVVYERDPAKSLANNYVHENNNNNKNRINQQTCTVTESQSRQYIQIKI